MSKVIVITGGSEGLGKAIAKRLIKDNKIIIISNNEEKLKKTATEIQCDYVVCDVTNYKQIENAIDTILKKYINIDILINNAGVWLEGDLTENTFEKISNCIDVNTKGPIYMTKAVLPNMYKNKSGLIINVCSQASFDNDDYSVVYNASKWAVRGFNRSIQRDISKKGVKVTGFYPGFMQTNLFKKAGNDYDTSTGLEVGKVAKAIEYIINVDSDVIIPEMGIKDIEEY